MIRAGAAATAAPRGVVRVSVASDGTQANSLSRSPVVSGDGRYVAFESLASNLVPDDTNGRRDIFVYDRVTGITTRESISSGHAEANADCTSPQISQDGRFVTFGSFATTLVSGVTSTQLYIRDRQLGLTEVASVSSNGTAIGGGGNALSADGRFVSFTTAAGGTNGFQVYTRDRSTGTTTLDSVSSSGAASDRGASGGSISDDGRYVSFYSNATNLVSGLTPGGGQVYVHDRSTGQTTLGSVGPAGEVFYAAYQHVLSSDGRFLAFLSPNDSSSQTTYSIYVRDLQPGQTTFIMPEQGHGVLRMSRDGRFVSRVNRVDEYYVDVFDRSTGRMLTVAPAEDHSAVAGNVIAFASRLALVGGDTNGNYDIYVAPIGSDPGAPGAPTNLTSEVTGSTLTLTWTAPSGGAAVSDYLLEVGSIPKSTDIFNAFTGLTDTRFSRSYPGAGQIYIRVRAANAAGVSEPSNEIEVTPTGLPAAPRDLTSSVTGNTVTLTWLAPSGTITSYIIEAGSRPNMANLANFDTGSTSTTYTASNVPNGLYFVRVRAVSAAGVGAPSSDEGINVPGSCPYPGAPTNLTSSVAGSSVTLSWSAGAFAVSYILEAGSATGRSDLVVADLNSAATTFATSGVPAGTYYVRLRTRNSCAQSVNTSNETVVTVSQ